MQRVFGAVVVDVGIVTLQTLLGASLGFFGSGYVDFLRTFGGFGEDGDLVRQHFRESPSYGERVRGAVRAIAERARFQFRDERGMAGEDSKIAILARNLRFFGGNVFDHLLFRGDDLELESVCHELSAVSCQPSAYR